MTEQLNRTIFQKSNTAVIGGGDLSPTLEAHRNYGVSAAGECAKLYIDVNYQISDSFYFFHFIPSASLGIEVPLGKVTL